MMSLTRLAGYGLILLGLGLIGAALLGPLALDLIDFRVSDTMENQVVGGDVASLLLAGPLALVAGRLWLRNHRLAPVLALAPSIYAVYYGISIVVGEQYDRYPGNIEKFFPLYLGLILLGWSSAAIAWSQLRVPEAVAADTGLRRATAGVLLALGILLGLAWARSIWGIASGRDLTDEYLGDPNVYWGIKLLDTAFVIPLAVATGVGLLRDSHLARKVACAFTGYLTCQAAAVAGMAAVMLWRDDPSASVPFLIFTGIGTLALGYLTIRWLRSYGHPQRASAAPGRVTV